MRSAPLVMTEIPVFNAMLYKVKYFSKPPKDSYYLMHSFT